MKHIVFLIFILWAGSVSADKPAYRIFNADGNPVDFHTMQQVLEAKDIVFFGERHNNPIAHWLQLELTRHLYNHAGDSLLLGAEMFEADDQLILQEYLNGRIAEKNFKEEVKLWTNYQTDYRPLVEYAKRHGLAFIATNIPRRYASMVAKGGFEALESLGQPAREYIAPLPVDYNPDLPGYKRMLKMHHMPGRKSGSGNLPKAQAIKDATMAHFILDHFKEGSLFLHFNGTYHTNNKEGIVWYIRQKAPHLDMGTIATVSQNRLDQLAEENQGLADFILVVPDNMTKTH